jgi:L-amino acid N-acyltransferase YncA
MEELLVRPATLSDLGQVSEIFSHYNLNTFNSNVATPASMVDLTQYLRKCQELGYPFVVLVFKEVPHIVLGFCYASPDFPRLATFPHLVSMVGFLRDGFKGKGAFNRLIIPLIYKEFLQHPHFRGVWYHTNYANLLGMQSITTQLTGLEYNSGVVLRNGGYKLGKYQDIVFFYLSPKVVKAILSRREHL